MSLPQVFHPAVQGEIDDAYHGYEQRQTNLGQDFLMALDEVFNAFSKRPRRIR